MKRRKMFFFEKKNQKTFGPGGVGTGIAVNRLRTEAMKGNPALNLAWTQPLQTCKLKSG